MSYTLDLRILEATDLADSDGAENAPPVLGDLVSADGAPGIDAIALANACSPTSASPMGWMPEFLRTLVLPKFGERLADWLYR